MIATLGAYASLFFAGLIAATFFPAQSEAVLAALHLSGNYSTLGLLMVATVGNVLGSLINWLLGRYIAHFRDRWWFPFPARSIDRASDWYQRWGVWSLLLAWTPFLGDPLTLVAGILRTNIWVFLALVTAGKAGRYAFLLAVL